MRAICRDRQLEDHSGAMEPDEVAYVVTEAAASQHDDCIEVFCLVKLPEFLFIMFLKRGASL